MKLRQVRLVRSDIDKQKMPDPQLTHWQSYCWREMQKTIEQAWFGKIARAVSRLRFSHISPRISTKKRCKRPPMRSDACCYT